MPKNNDEIVGSLKLVSLSLVEFLSLVSRRCPFDPVFFIQAPRSRIAESVVDMEGKKPKKKTVRNFFHLARLNALIPMGVGGMMYPLIWECETFLGSGDPDEAEMPTPVLENLKRNNVVMQAVMEFAVKGRGLTIVKGLMVEEQNPAPLGEMDVPLSVPVQPQQPGQENKDGQTPPAKEGQPAQAGVDAAPDKPVEGEGPGPTH